MYEMRDDIPGVRFVRGGHTDWIPVQKSELDQATDHEEGKKIPVIVANGYL